MAPNEDIATYDLLGIGGAHVDRIGRVSEKHRPGASNPGHLMSTVGGGVLNALRNGRLRGTDTVAIISARGGDTDGQASRRRSPKRASTDLSAVFLDRRTASYTAILDEDGELVTGLADMDIYETALPRQLRRHSVRDALAAAACVLVDANLPEDALAAIAEAHAGPLKRQSPCRRPRRRGCLAIAERLGTVFMNRNELVALTGADDRRSALAALCERGITRAVVTAGAGSVAVMDGSRYMTLRGPTVAEVRDVTGAGDALAGATLARLAGDPAAPLAEAVRDGIAAACLTIQAAGPVAASLTGAPFEAMRAGTTIVEEN